MQTAEINKLKAIPEERGSYMEAEKVREYSERIDNIQLKLEQKNTIIQKLTAQSEIDSKEKQAKINMMQNENSSLKNQIDDLKTQNQLFEQEVKRHQEQALLSLVQPDDEKKASLEKEINE